MPKKCFMINLCDSLAERYYTLIAVHYANELNFLFIRAKYPLHGHTAVELVWYFSFFSICIIWIGLLSANYNRVLRECMLNVLLKI